MSRRGVESNVDSDDYYEILGVSRRADAAAIKKAYRKLALKWHPDRHSGADSVRATLVFQKVGEAYNILSNPQERAAYDRFGKGGIEGAFGSGGGGGGRDGEFDASSFFDAFFGGANAEMGERGVGGAGESVSYDGGKTHIETKDDGKTYVSWKRPLTWLEKRRRRKLKEARKQLSAAEQRRRSSVGADDDGAASGGGGGAGSSAHKDAESSEEEDDFVVIEKETKYGAARHLFGMAGQVLGAVKVREELAFIIYLFTFVLFAHSFVCSLVCAAHFYGALQEQRRAAAQRAKEEKAAVKLDAKARKQQENAAMKEAATQARKERAATKDALKAKSEGELSRMRVKELKVLIAARGLDSSHCVEKTDIVQLILAHDRS